MGMFDNHMMREKIKSYNAPDPINKHPDEETSKGLICTKEMKNLCIWIHKLEKDVRIREDDFHEPKGKIVRREAEWVNTSESLKNDITKSYVVGFEGVVERAALFTPK
ncbi:hypothetical protein ACSQ67_006416 [Phaseolus vulgaris]